MAQFDVVRLKSGEWVIDCQSDLLNRLGSRFVVPLRLLHEAPPAEPRLNPIFEVNGDRRVMVTQYAGAISVSDIALTVQSLGAEQYTIKNAIDMLLSGF